LSDTQVYEPEIRARLGTGHAQVDEEASVPEVVERLRQRPCAPGQTLFILTSIALLTSLSSAFDNVPVPRSARV